jgi:integrase
MLPIGWHTLRHTFASHLVMRGVAIVTVQRLMGHANIRMTLKYAHLSPHVSREAVMLLDEPAPLRPKTKRRAAKVPDAPQPSPSV